MQRMMAWLREPKHLPRVALLVTAGCVTTYFVSVAIVLPQPGRDVQSMAAIVALALAGLLILRWKRADAGWVEKAAMFLALVMAVYFDRQTATFLEAKTATQMGVFGVLVIAIVIRFRLASDRRFRVTPLDILVIFIAVAVPNLPGSIISAAAMGESIAKLVTLMYGVETLFGAGARWWRWPCIAAVCFLAACSLHGLF